MRTVKDLMGATVNPNIADIQLSTDDETQSELRLTDIGDETEKVNLRKNIFSRNFFASRTFSQSKISQIRCLESRPVDILFSKI
jgi:hypothetical protein